MSIFNRFDGSSDGDSLSLFDAPQRPEPPVPPPQRLEWTAEQHAAVEEIVRWRFDPRAPRFLKLTGPAGVGKTAVTRELRRRLAGTRTAWSGTTGKAALRLRAAVGVAKTTTAHSALYHPPQEVDNPEEARVDLEFSDVKRGDVEDDALLVIDEASMIGPRFRADLERSSYAKVLLVGDPFQLSPVLSKAEEAEAGGEDYSVFAGLPGPHLSRVMRHGGAVLAAATEVRERLRVPTQSMEDQGSRYDYVEVAGTNDAVPLAVEEWMADREGHVLIAWTNATRLLANAIVRHRLGYAEERLPVPGEPLVVRRNAHRQGLMNGDLVWCKKVGPEGPDLAGISTRWFTVVEHTSGRPVSVLAPSEDFSGSMPYVGLETWRAALREARIDCDVIPMTFAYCLTAHTAQGSGYRRVTVVCPGDFRSANFLKPTRLHDGSTVPFAWRFLYTALSRAVRRATLILAK